MPTRLEQQIISTRRTKRKGQILVPMLHELLKRKVEIETEEDAEFIHTLMQLGVMREKQRQEGYENNQMVFSPSSLASCLRKVYLSKKHQDLGLERVELPNVNAHSYFFTGDWIHLKWQFALYKLNQLMPKDFMLLELELPVMSKHGDHGGTIDALALIYGEPFLIDVKGLNVRGFQNVDFGTLQDEYRIQLADYIMLFNAQRGWPIAESWKKVLGLEKFPKIERGIILAENKGGPDSGHPAGITERIVNADENIPEVRLRLGELRRHEEANTIPQIECTNTRTIQFQGCPFANFCKKEVTAYERAHASRKDSAEFRVATPTGNNRSRRTRSK